MDGTTTSSRPNLRERQKAQTRELILEAVVSEVMERGPVNFSMQDVASRAGIALRTVYQHFRTRQDLVEALYAWVDDKFRELEVIESFSSAEELFECIERTFAVFDTYPQLVATMVRLADAEGARPAQYHQRSAQMQEALVDITDALATDERHQITAMTRYLLSSRAWHYLRFECGLSGEATRAIVQRTARVLWADARGAGGRKGGHRKTRRSKNPRRHHEGRRSSIDDQ